MEQSKLQKIAGAIVPILIIGGVFGYKYYNNYSVKQTNKFIESYNSFNTSTTTVFVAFEAKIDENGKMRNPSEIDPAIEKAKKLKDSDCNYITKKDVKEECIALFTKTESIFTELKEKGMTEEVSKKMEELTNLGDNFEKSLTEKLKIKML